MANLRIKVLVMDGGERFPVLVASTGIPLFRPTVWSTTMRRAAHAASATLASDLVALKLLYRWADRERIPLEERMLCGCYLTSGELGSLVQAARLPLDMLAEDTGPRHPRCKVVALERHRQRAPSLPSQVAPQTAATRLNTIVTYLRWLTQEGLGRGGLDKMADMIKVRDAMLDSLLVRVPKSKGRNVVGQREAPPIEIMDRVMSVLELDAPDNPWDDLGMRARNRLLAHIIYGLGVRRGEALGIKVENIDFRQNTVLIARCSDDPDDPRKYQPLTKTRDRELPMKDSLAAMIQQYVTHVRARFLRARRHPFLFISHQTGAPLALASANKVFRSLRERVDGLPENLTPHVLRHAWNDAFSRLLDRRADQKGRRRGEDHADEERMRSYLMGWSPASKMASVYTRRHVRETAEKMSLAHQEDLLKGARK